jgi:hypothetical protein
MLSTAAALWNGIDELHEAYLAGLKANPGKLPLVALSDINETGNPLGPSFEPKFEITKWVPRPADLPVGGIAVAAPAPAPAKKAAVKPRDDLNDEIGF